MSHKHTNHLSTESSPYLIQHAHNPVDWYPWGDEALNRAKQEDKPILVSIGYAACHWCHVMERESFEDESTAELMNANFINIKIDREERPDLDHIYMDAVQAISGSGGWPLNVFLTPEAKPFYGGTYFPPVRAFNRPSWKETLTAIIQSFSEKRNEINAQAENLTEHLSKANFFGQTVPVEGVFKVDSLQEIAKNLMKQADTSWGGFGKAPKFPQTFSIQYLLRHAASTVSPGKDNKTELNQALLSLDKMIEGGIYDQIGGGFSRYSTDNEWLAPHFEKMLYDNALLITVLSEAYQLTKKTRYREVIQETIAFIEREMLHPLNGFYAALDADSEGEEGKFYIWDYDEVKSLLENDAEIFCEYYDISKTGNWSEGGKSGELKNILRVKKTMDVFSIEKGIKKTDLFDILQKGRKILFDQRSKRVSPLLDDKIILGWNALMNIALSKAFAATGEEKYRQLAIRNMIFLFEKFSSKEDNSFNHTWKNDKAKFPAFLDDYAYLIYALIQLQEITTDTQWLLKAKDILVYVIGKFSDEENNLFYYTSIEQADIIVRKKEVYDGAVPSGNAVMAYNLHQLAILFDEKSWSERSDLMISSLSKAVISYPGSFGIWAMLLLEKITGTNEIVIAGKDVGMIHNQVLEEYVPNRVLMATEKEDLPFPLLIGKQALVHPAIYLCRNYTCLAPVFSAKDLMLLINNTQNGQFILT